MNKTKAFKTILLASCCTVFSYAEGNKDFNQSIDVGFINTTGNTKTSNLNIRHVAKYTTNGYQDKPLSALWGASMFWSKDSGATTSEEYMASLGLQQEVYNGWFGYANVDWLRNEFRNYNNRWSIGTGVGKTLYDDGKQKLDAKLGVAYNIEQYYNNQKDQSFGSLNQYVEYNNKLNPTSLLYAKLGAMENFEDFSNDYSLLGVAGLKFALTEALFVNFEQSVNYDALPPVGYKTTDTKTIIGLGYKF